MDLPKREEQIIKFWQQRKIFQKSLKQNKKRPYFSFYDGPPFATGLPHYGHILASTVKDTVLRYWSQHRYRVEWRVGWDCHGLPVENLIEKELGVKTKKEIEKKIGVGKFNRACRNSVFRCVNDFQKILQRIGRWADYANAYATLDPNYTESVWWVFKKLFDKKLIYQDYRVTPYCPRCGTPLSNFEVNLGYKNVEDESIYVKFALLDQPQTFFLVWTTTPWTLPANLAIAVNQKFEYVKIRLENNDNNLSPQFLILAKKRLGIIKGNYKIIENLSGRKLVGLAYSPLYKLRNHEFNLEQKNKIFKVVPADFVTLEEGTGLVHMAPAFGEDDRQVGKKFNLPILITINSEGSILKGLGIPGEGKFVKEADKDIKTDLKKRNLLYRAEKIKHIYPFCYRCDTPLLYYPLKSWYLKVTDFRKQLVANNQKINWRPNYLKNGRFGKWLKGARDWCLSRNRYWGAPIPIWECSHCQKKIAVGSKQELGRLSTTSNFYYLLRHGETSCHQKGIIANDINHDTCHLTSAGKKQIQEVAKKLRKEKIDVIFASDLRRTKETANIVAKTLGLKVEFSPKLRDLNVGLYNGRRLDFIKEQVSFAKNPQEAFPKGESLVSCWQRMKDVFHDTESKYQGKKVLVIGHAFPLKCFEGILKGHGLSEVRAKRNFEVAELKKIVGKKWPFNESGEFDFHRPYIDEVTLKCPICHHPMKRVPEVFDCWFESGSMPYAQWHYPFSHKKVVEKTFPADFIAEGVDQTRGWFYTLHVLATALTLENIGLGKNKPAFKNVIAHGLVLGEDGRKLSKHLKNYSSPNNIIDHYGADALRFFLLSSTPIGQDYIFSQKRLSITFRQVIVTLWNSWQFLKTYLPKGFILTPKIQPQNILDKWILSRLGTLEIEIEKQMKAYQLTKATRLIGVFIDDLSNWYIRRSRINFQKESGKTDKIKSANLLGFTLLRLSQISAPFMPFLSEMIYQWLKEKAQWKLPESVHLTRYPEKEKSFQSIALERKMKLAREIVAEILSQRSSHNLKIRQPLSKVSFPLDKLKNKKLWKVVQEETNIQKIVFNQKQKENIILDTKLTPELKEAGFLREFMHDIRSLRKKTGFNRFQKTSLSVTGNEKFVSLVQKNQAIIQKETLLQDIHFPLRESDISQQETYLQKDFIFLEFQGKIYLRKN